VLHQTNRWSPARGQCGLIRRSQTAAVPADFPDHRAPCPRGNVPDRFDYKMPEGFLTADDDNFHAPKSDGWFEHETVWLWFCVPERKIGCWVYHYVRPNIGVDGGRVHLWTTPRGTTPKLPIT
jgi:hypothetical protein